MGRVVWSLILLGLLVAAGLTFLQVASLDGVEWRYLLKVSPAIALGTVCSFLLRSWLASRDRIVPSWFLLAGLSVVALVVVGGINGIENSILNWIAMYGMFFLFTSMLLPTLYAWWPLSGIWLTVLAFDQVGTSFGVVVLLTFMFLLVTVFRGMPLFSGRPVPVIGQIENTNPWRYTNKPGDGTTTTDESGMPVSPSSRS